MKKAFFRILIVCISILAVWSVYNRFNRSSLAPAEILGGVIRMENEGSDRLFYLTSQWETRETYSSSRVTSSKTTNSWLNVDLWEIDATTAQPLSRRRIKQAKVNADAKALGVEQGVLWARIPELVGIRLADGVIVADMEKIAARNPAIADLLPKPPETAFFLTASMQPLKFDPEAGLSVRLDDAREVRIDPISSEAFPYAAPQPESKPPTEPTSPALRRKLISPAYGTDWSAMVRGLAIPQNGGDKEWLGLLTEADLEMMQEIKAISWQMDFTKPQRSRLFRAKLSGLTGALGTGEGYQNPTLLTESPEFLMAGLLTQEVSDHRNPTALWQRGPDSVFVISLDRLGDAGRLALTRVSAENGAPVWSVVLPLAKLSAWIPGEHHALIMGPAPSEKRSPMAAENDNPVLHILSVDLKTGAFQSFNPDLHRDWQMEDSSKKSQ